MKKVVALFVSACAVFGLAACNGAAPSAPVGSGSVLVTSAPSSSAPAASSSSSASISTAASSTSASVSGMEPGFMGEWEIKDVGFMGTTFTLEQLEAMVNVASGQLDAILSDQFTTEDIRTALEAFKGMKARISANGTGTIYYDENPDAMQDIPFTWSQSGGEYEITIQNQTAPLRYNTDGTLTFTYMNFEVNFSQIAQG